jgi:5-methyltetrahydropteroyltriglutamate--homocysteine methyltransferase
MLTTHTGSLPRPNHLLGLLRDREEGRGDAEPALHERTRSAVFDVVRRQREAGLSVINDGEQGRADYTIYVKDRLTGFAGESMPWPNPDAEEFPEWSEMARQFAPPFQKRPACSGPVAWKDWPAVERDIRNLRDAVDAGTRAEEVFMTSPSPGQIGRFLQNRYYPDDATYLYTLADVMKREYQAIVQAGFILQADCPDLALGRHTQFAHLTLEEFRKVAEMHVDVLNYAVADIAPERMRMHICWASTGGPHHRDVPLRDIVDVVIKGRPAGLVVAGANPRHEHEWKVWRESPAACRQGPHCRRDRLHVQLHRASGAGGRTDRPVCHGGRPGEPHRRRGLRIRNLRRQGPGRYQHRLAQAPLARGGSTPRFGGTLVRRRARRVGSR